MTVQNTGVGININIVLPVGINTLKSKVTRKLPGLIRRIALEGKSFWKSLAGARLKSSREKYQRSIKFDVTSNLTATLALTDRFALDIEFGSPGFDMRPGFMAGAKSWAGKKKKFPASIRSLLRAKSPITMYRIIPLNVRGYISMSKPTTFRTIHDQSSVAQTGPNAGKNAWQHPGIKNPANLIDEVMDELANNIIPRQVDQFMKDNL